MLLNLSSAPTETQTDPRPPCIGARKPFVQSRDRSVLRVETFCTGTRATRYSRAEAHGYKPRQAEDYDIPPKPKQRCDGASSHTRQLVFTRKKKARVTSLPTSASVRREI